MGWVRGHIRHGAVIALAALALQFVLSFGHVHLDGIRPVSVHAAARHVALTQVPDRAPAQNPGDNDDYCAICASIYLASTSLVAHAPPLPVPLVSHRIAHALSADRSVIAPRLVAFQSRAPPAA